MAKPGVLILKTDESIIKLRYSIIKPDTAILKTGVSMTKPDAFIIEPVMPAM